LGTESSDIYAAARVRAKRSTSAWLRWRERRLVAALRSRRPRDHELARLAAARAELAHRADLRSARG
jgi:hypothetical protein